jgi:hypothetical protein
MLRETTSRGLCGLVCPSRIVATLYKIAVITCYKIAIIMPLIYRNFE